MFDRNASTLSYVENQIILKNHFDYSIFSQSSELFCEDVYCENFDSLNESEQKGTRINRRLSSEDCMDMCLCDEDCIIFAFGDYENCLQVPDSDYGEDAPEYDSYGPCTMCRLFHSYDASEIPPTLTRYTGYDSGFSQFVVGAKSDDLLPILAARGDCVDSSACENPLSSSGTDSFDNLADSSCQCLLLNSTCPDVNPEDNSTDSRS